jgi:hypothetical protein
MTTDESSNLRISFANYDCPAKGTNDNCSQLFSLMTMAGYAPSWRGKDPNVMLQLVLEPAADPNAIPPTQAPP